MPGRVVSQLRSNQRQEVVAIFVHQVPRRDFSAYVKAAEGRARIVNSADRHNHGGHTRNGVPFELQLCDPWIFRMSDRHLADAGARYLAYRPPIRPVPQENRQEVEPTRRVRRPEPERNRDTRRLNVLTVAQNRPVRLNIPRVLCDLRAFDIGRKRIRPNRRKNRRHRSNATVAKRLAHVLPHPIQNFFGFGHQPAIEDFKALPIEATAAPAMIAPSDTTAVGQFLFSVFVGARPVQRSPRFRPTLLERRDRLPAFAIKQSEERSCFLLPFQGGQAS